MPERKSRKVDFNFCGLTFFVEYYGQHNYILRMKVNVLEKIFMREEKAIVLQLY